MILLFAGVFLLAGSGAAAVWLRRWPRLAERAYLLLAVAGAAGAMWPALRVVGGGAVEPVRLATGVPGGAWVFAIDPLSAWFLLVVLGAGLAALAYGAFYLAAEAEHGSVPLGRLVFSLLLAALVLVVTAQSVVPFLAAWELMALSGYFAVVFDDRQDDTRRAGLVYLVATHAGTLLLFLLFGTWGSHAADLTFAGLAAAAHQLGDARSLVLALALLGFGVKAGFVPLHFWLPEAHAAAPSHVSAIMSGVVIKTGIYGLLRVVTMLQLPPAWWAWTVFLLGAASAVLGVLWALAQHDVKRLLAYHSVENIGIILLGLGVGALGLAYRAPLLSVLGLAGAVLHTLNHALFKSLLFLGAGNVVRATGTRELERLGGLARGMPITWAVFLVGSAAIVGLPPLNGFVSEWLVFQAMFQAGVSRTPAELSVFGTAVLGLVGGLALACFAKVCGVVFLGRARSEAGQAAREVTPGYVIPGIALAVACVGIGVWPALVLAPALRVAAFVAGMPPAAALELARPAVSAGQRIALLAALGVVVSGLLWWLRTLALRRAGTAAAQTWGCGYARPTARMQYSASSFAAPLLAVFGPVTGVREVRHASSYETHAANLVLERGVLPLWRVLRAASDRLRPIQHGRLQLYLLYLVATVSLLLIYLAVWGSP
ncbi:MAG TPA: proton-conducting transporter membrane subunit [Gemmatimonadales bacterium]|nr:proton-conducting transporter membrane subunit [Gemmatimonadales bacterium]